MESKKQIKSRKTERMNKHNKTEIESWIQRTHKQLPDGRLVEVSGGRLVREIDGRLKGKTSSYKISESQG